MDGIVKVREVIIAKMLKENKKPAVVAKELGLSPLTVSHFLKGRNTVNWFTAQKLLHYAGIELDNQK